MFSKPVVLKVSAGGKHGVGGGAGARGDHRIIGFGPSRGSGAGTRRDSGRLDPAQVLPLAAGGRGPPPRARGPARAGPAPGVVGAADGWGPASACEQMVASARGRSAQAQIVVYPGAYAEFDHPNKPVSQVTGLAFSADGSGRAHLGTNPAARADAIRRVPQWLAR